MNCNRALRAVQEDFSVLLAVNPGKNLDQRRFPGAVLPHQCMNFTLAQCKVHTLQGVHAGEDLVNVSHF